MVLVGLLLALACLVVGIALASSAWLVASLVATVAAGVLLWTTRASRGGATPPRAGAHTSAAHTSAVSTLAAHTVAVPTVAVPAPAVPTVAAHAAADPEILPAASGSAPGSPSPSASAVAEQVWVVDGRPLYHRADCALIKDLPAEAISIAQATEDGFLRCSLCEPKLARIG